MLNNHTIQPLLSNAYQRENWINFLRQLVGGGYRLNAPQISLPTNEISEKAYEIGQFETTDNMLVGVYEVKIKDGINIENKRVGLRNLLKSVYKVVDAALIVFDTGEAWRFSYVSEIYTRDNAGNRQQLKTDPKRYTYVLGKGGGVRTATERFEGLAKKNQQIKLKDLTDAFSVEILTKDFYRELSDWYFWALTKVKFPEDAEPNEEVRNATSTIRLITRLMFVWFLKQKNLVPDELFDETELKKILKNFNSSRSLSEVEGNTYYKAILQNLFFATLNIEMTDDKRKFINRQTGVQGFYRYERYFENKELFLELTRNVPFLNGGLFENLDRNVGEANEIRIDCFSNKLSNQNRLNVPDYLFFGEETIDLSSIYDDKKRKAVKVKGLINILKSYNFTVEENTPTDIEVALDPELLGKVFENLLASYNPETKTTARKQTGSFYTPREIVEYMVDESLKAYLNEQLSIKNKQGFLELGKKQTMLFGNEVKKGQLDLVENLHPSSSTETHEEKLEQLFSYASEENPFDEANTQLLIKAIDQCRILDPACGSGAFPMGVLQRLVFLLKKLDPQNEFWRERQIERATKEFQEALRTGQSVDIQTRVKEITDTFQNNTNDYGRKLFLIENCIYGVDIQPIAVQIAKLRFFISLMAEQNPLQQGANRGIRPLPNLETKFVAANTLIGLEKPVQLLLKNTKIDDLEKQLEAVRHKHFFARTAETKRKYRDLDKELRLKIAELLSIDGWKPSTANQVAAWNPYDQSTHAPFFDPEWMFGIIDGFDIVIGNPPYGFRTVLSKEEKDYFRKIRNIEFSSGDSAELFSKICFDSFIGKNGILTFIIPKKSLYGDAWEDTRVNYWKKYDLLFILDTGKSFDNVLLEASVFGLKKSKSNSKVALAFLNEQFKIQRFDNVNIDEIFVKSKTCQIYKVLYPNKLFKNILAKSYSEKVVEGKLGLAIGTDFFSDEPKEYKLLKGIDVQKFQVRSHRYLNNQDKLDWKNAKSFLKPKIICQRLIAHIENPVPHLKITACFDEEGILITNTLMSFELDKSIDDKFFLAYLNSTFVSWYAYNFIYCRAIRGMDFYNFYIQQLPIPRISLSSQTPFLRIVDYILHLKKQETAEAELMASYFEQIIDGLVYELYFEEELHTAGVYFHKHLQDLPEGVTNIEQIFATLYAPTHAVRAGLFRLSSIEEVAIVEGKGR